MAEIGILNVGAGDTKLTFDNRNPAETIRAGRIVKDMLRRGYALLVEVEQSDGTKAFQRVKEFRENSCEYVIADFDPMSVGFEAPTPQGEHVNIGGQRDEEAGAPATDSPSEGSPEAPAARPRGRPRTRDRVIPAATARGVAVARSAGG